LTYHADVSLSNLPIGGVVLALVFFLLRLPKATNQDVNAQKTTLLQTIWKLDPLGAVLVIAAVVCILLALQWGGQSLPWNSSEVIGLLVGFVLLMAVFIWTQWRLGDDATLPLWVFKQRSLLAGAIFSFLMAMPSYVVSSACLPNSSHSLLAPNDLIIRYANIACKSMELISRSTSKPFGRPGSSRAACSSSRKPSPRFSVLS
jgi:hypothetical protein